MDRQAECDIHRARPVPPEPISSIMSASRRGLYIYVCMYLSIYALWRRELGVTRPSNFSLFCSAQQSRAYMVGLFLFSLQTYIYNNTQRKAFWMKFTLKQNTRQNTYISLRFSFFFSFKDQNAPVNLGLGGCQSEADVGLVTPLHTAAIHIFTYVGVYWIIHRVVRAS